MDDQRQPNQRTVLLPSADAFARWQLRAVATMAVAGTCWYLVLFFEADKHLRVYGELIDPGREQSIPTFFSIINLLLLSVLSLAARTSSRDRGERSTFGALAVLTAYFALDESASIHERFSSLSERLERTTAFPRLLGNNQWVYFGAVFVAIVSVLGFRSARHVDAQLRRSALVAAILFFGGAVGVETLASIWIDTGVSDGFDDWPLLINRLTEETLEMSGVAVLNVGLYRHLARRRAEFLLVPAPLRTA